MKYNKKTSGLVLKALASGKNRVESAKIGGITYKTYCEWYNKYPDFKELTDEILLIRNEVEKEDLISTIKVASKTSWQAAAWFLERKYPEEFALRKQQVELTGKVDHNIKQIQINVSDNETKKLMDNIIKIVESEELKKLSDDNDNI